MNELYEKVAAWHQARNLIDGSTDKDQVLALAEEVGEACDTVGKGKVPIDDIGDMLVVLINLYERNKLNVGSYSLEGTKLRAHKVHLAQVVAHVGMLTNFIYNRFEREDLEDVLNATTHAVRRLAHSYGLTDVECLQHAYNDIKDRKGRMVGGVFVKESS